MAEPHRFAVLVVSLWVERDGRARARVSARSDREGGELARVVYSVPELLETVERWADPFLTRLRATDQPSIPT